MALQLTGAFKRDALPNLQVRLPAVVIGGGLTGIDTATELLAYYPVQVEKTLERYEALVAELGEDARARACTTPRSSRSSTSSSSTAARSAPSARAPRRPASAPNFVAAGARVGRRVARLPQAHGRFAGLSPEPRRGRSRRSRKASRSSRTSTRSRRVPDERGARAGADLQARATGSGRHGRRCRRARSCVAAGTTPEHDLREGVRRAPSSSTRRSSSSSRTAADARRRRRAHARRRTPNGFFTSYNNDGTVRLASTATTTRTTPATSSRRWRRPSTAIRTSSTLFADELAALDAGAAAAARRGVASARRDGSTTSCWRAVERGRCA